MEFVVEKLPKLTQEFLETVSYLIVFAFTAGYAYFAWDMTSESFQLVEKSPMVNIVMWPIKGIIFIAMVVLCLQALRMMCSSISGLIKKLGQTKQSLKHAVISTAFLLQR